MLPVVPASGKSLQASQVRAGDHHRGHRAQAEPHGPGTGGTIVSVTCSGNVMADVNRMVEDMVMSLVGYNDQFDWKGWPLRWNEERSNKARDDDAGEKGSPARDRLVR